MITDKPIVAVVGAGKGIGMAVAERFGKAGYFPILMSRSSSLLAVKKQSLLNKGIESAIVAIDVSSPQAVKLAFEKVRNEYGNPHVLIYNPASGKNIDPLTLPEQSWIDDFKTNVVGAVSCIQEVVPFMKENKTGTILLTGGGLALNPIPGYASLAVGKAGLRNLAQSFNILLRTQNIHVATVTINGFVSTKDPVYNPKNIAEHFWFLHANLDKRFEINI